MKLYANGSLESYKGRLVAIGFYQKEGDDFDDIFSPVVKMVTLGAVIALTVSRNWELH